MSAERMSANTAARPDGPFDPGPEGHDGHLVLGNTDGRVSLWPAWRTLPPGWTARFGPAPHEACVRWVQRG